jgi:hypothetical protein
LLLGVVVVLLLVGWNVTVNPLLHFLYLPALLVVQFQTFVVSSLGAMTTVEV